VGRDSSIEWTHHTFNPWWGCTRVSEGCVRCYAETFAKRVGVQWGPQAERRFFGDKHWSEPLKWNREAEKAGERRRVFCASMADVFEDRPELVDQRLRLWLLIEQTPHLDWLLLTKRPENMAWMAPPWWRPWPANVWPMATVESQEVAARRIMHLLEIPAAVHGLSVEPLLGPLNLREVEIIKPVEPYGPGVSLDALTGHLIGPDDILPHRVSWVIVGGESGHGARPLDPAWVRSLRDQCTDAGTAFFFKQWGEHYPLRTVGPPNEMWRFDRVGKKAAGNVLDGRTWAEMP
jgi:protein gp37